MFSVIKAIIGGSEGKLALTYQRLGMVNALRELSKASGGKIINKLAPSVSSFILACYKDERSEEVKLALLSALASWASKSAEAVQPAVVSFIASGLKEEILRKGYLKCLRFICKNSDSLTRVLPLLDILIQLVKTGFTKESQRLDGIYALFLVVKVASIDTKTEEILVKERIWSLIAQNESSLLPIPQVLKLSNEDSITCIDLLEVLLVEHLNRFSESPSRMSSLMKLLLHLVCHPHWDVRKVANDAIRKISSSSSNFALDICLEFRNWLSVTGDTMSVMNISDTEGTYNSQIQFLPSFEVLVNALYLMLYLIASIAVHSSPKTLSLLLLCSHHPCIVPADKSDFVWKLLQKKSQRHGFDVTHVVTANIESICKDLLGQMGLKSSNSLEQHAALRSLSTLKSTAPNLTVSAALHSLSTLKSTAPNLTFSESEKV